MALDKIQPLKLEDPTTGGSEVDQFPTELDPQEDHIECAGIVLDDVNNRDEKVRVTRDGDNLTFQDAINTTPTTLTQLKSASGSLTEAQHEALSTLTHDIDQTSFEEYLYTGNLVTSCITWTDSGKTQKVREEVYSYTSSRVTQVVTIQYDSSGVEKMRMTEVYSYSSSRVSSMTRTKTGSP